MINNETVEMAVFYPMEHEITKSRLLFFWAS